MKRRAGVTVAAGLAVLVASGCVAQDQELQSKVADLDARTQRVERVLSNQRLLELSNQIEALRADIRAMHNDVDVLNHDQELTRKQQHDLYADLDQRLKSIEGRGAAGTVTGPQGAAPAAGDGTEKAAYQAAFDLLKDSQYDQAIAAFQKFLATYPASQLADNAQYWLGEAYYVSKSYAEALAAFQRVVDGFPSSRKVADALLKIGYCHYELKQFAAARDALAQVQSKYPDSAAAPLAQQRLAKMADEKD